MDRSRDFFRVLGLNYRGPGGMAQQSFSSSTSWLARTAQMKKNLQRDADMGSIPNLKKELEAFGEEIDRLLEEEHLRSQRNRKQRDTDGQAGRPPSSPQHSSRAEDPEQEKLPPREMADSIMAVLRGLLRDREQRQTRKEHRRLQRQIERQDLFQKPGELHYAKPSGDSFTGASSPLRNNMIDKDDHGSIERFNGHGSTRPRNDYNANFYDQSSAAGASLSGAAYEADGSNALEAEAQSFMQLFERERERTSDVSRKLQSIQNTVTMMMQHVDQQDVQLDQIIDHGVQATANVEVAKTEFVKARERTNAYQFYLMCWFLCAAFILLAMDAVI